MLAMYYTVSGEAGDSTLGIQRHYWSRRGVFVSATIRATEKARTNE